MNLPVTVLMPVHNCSEFLPAAVKSILSQTYKNFEFLIIDNASTENVQGVVEKFNDERIRFIRIEEKGLGNALNFGLKIASNEIIVRMDADDISLPERIEKQLSFFLKQKENCIMSCSYGIFENCSLNFIVNVNTEHDEIKKKLALHSELVHAGMVFNKNFVLKSGGYKEHVFEDYELLLRVKNKAKFSNLSEVLLLYRYRTESLSRGELKEKKNLVYDIQQLYYEKDLQNEFGLNSDEEKQLRIWREFFFGNKFKAKKEWKESFELFLKDPRIFYAFLVTHLPEDLLIKFKEKRFRFRLDYLKNFTSSENKKLREVLKQYC